MSSHSSTPHDDHKDEHRKDDAASDASRKGPIGIDNRNESVRRYGNLEPEGYTRHQHGNREGEYQQGGKTPEDAPLEESVPMKDARFRKEEDKSRVKGVRFTKDEDKSRVPPDEYGGRTFDAQPGDRDIVDDLLKKRPAK